MIADVLSDLMVAEKHYASGRYRLVIVKDGRLLCSADEPRLLPLARCLVQLGADVQGAAIKDKIVGRAAGALLVFFGVAGVVSPLMSRGAMQMLQEAGIYCRAEEVVETISNQAGSGSCPMEAMVAPFSEPEAAAQHLLDFFTSKGLLPKVSENT